MSRFFVITNINWLS